MCEACGYVGVPADHRREPAETESWADAIRRFRDRRPRPPVPTSDRGPVGLTIDGRSYRVPRPVANRYADLTGKQRAVIAEVLSEPDPTDPDRTHREIARAAGVHRSYAGEVLRRFDDLLRALTDAVEPSRPP